MNWFDWLIAVLLGLSVFAWFYWRTGLALLWTVLIALGAFGVGLFGSFWIRTALAAAMAATPSAGVNNAPQQSGTTPTLAQCQNATLYAGLTAAQKEECIGILRDESLKAGTAQPAPTGGPSAPQPTAGAAPTPGTSGAGSCDGFVAAHQSDAPFDLIKLLDAQSTKVDQPASMTTLDGSGGCVLFWTGNYNGDPDRLPAGMVKISTKGQTGVFGINGKVTINTVGAYMPAASFDPNVTPNMDIDDNPSSCVPTQQLVDELNSFHTSDPERVFRDADSWVNVVGAPFLSARLRADQAHTYQAKAGLYVFWVAQGQISGTDGKDWVLLHASNGKAVYLAANNGPLEIKEAHAGMQLCDGMHPDQSLNYWNGR